MMADLVDFFQSINGCVRVDAIPRPKNPADSQINVGEEFIIRFEARNISPSDHISFVNGAIGARGVDGVSTLAPGQSGLIKLGDIAPGQTAVEEMRFVALKSVPSVSFYPWGGGGTNVQYQQLAIAFVHYDLDREKFFSDFITFTGPTDQIWPT
jgi:hypothetical protein